ncbi:flagellar motor switch protein FliN [bacterium]|nr:flagellar motor switch protein FliN [bacterium]
MAKKKAFDDPLQGIDPIMEEVFNTDIPETRPSFPARPKMEEATSTPVADVAFPTLTDEPAGKKIEMNVFSKIPVNVSVELGRANVSLKEIFELSEGSIIELERLVGEPLDLVVNGQVVAQGEVVAIDNNYGLRVTHVVAQPSA